MALPPDSSDSFAREVDENLRRDRAETFFKTYGLWLIAAVVLILAAVGGWIYWQNQQRQEAEAQSEELQGAFADISAERLDQASERLAPIEQADSDALRASAILTQAAVAMERNQRDEALNRYRSLSNDQGVPEVYRNVATLRATAIEFDSLEPGEIIARLQPMAQPGNPFFGSAAEMTALAHMRQNENERAGELFAAIAANRQVPESLRSRAVQAAGSLGADASASLPANEQQDTGQ